ncbi:MAG: hypothetical protein QOH91_3739, partial [Mycobacterium sp.]|nr:hypothetical protein [Mycobacterium sp.]
HLGERRDHMVDQQLTQRANSPTGAPHSGLTMVRSVSPSRPNASLWDDVVLRNPGHEKLGMKLAARPFARASSAAPLPDPGVVTHADNAPMRTPAPVGTL